MVNIPAISTVILVFSKRHLVPHQITVSARDTINVDPHLVRISFGTEARGPRTRLVILFARDHSTGSSCVILLLLFVRVDPYVPK